MAPMKAKFSPAAARRPDPKASAPDSSSRRSLAAHPLWPMPPLRPSARSLHPDSGAATLFDSSGACPGERLLYATEPERRGPVDDYHTEWAGRDERVFSYLPLEREILNGLPPRALILDLGCGDGSHMRLLAAGGHVFGSDVSVAGLLAARGAGPVVGAEGERLPFRDGAFDLVHVSHVLHHAHDFRAVLSEANRVLKPAGRLVLIETCEDNPLMRLARTVRPSWESVPVRSRFRYAELLQAVRGAGFITDRTEQFNVLYWMWGFARRHVRSLEGLAPAVVRLELRAVRRLRSYSAYGYVIARREEGNTASG